MIRLSKFFLYSLLSLVLLQSLNAQDNSVLHKKPWNTFWIGPNEESNEYGVYQFKKEVTLSSKPSSFIVHVSGDNRYKLFVNNKLASLGPTRGDIFHWKYETVNIGALLQQGKNEIKAVVWNDGSQKPEAQISYRTAFILQGNTSNEEILNTDKSWKVIKDQSYLFGLQPNLINTYYVSGPGEMVDMKQQPTESSSWNDAKEIFHGLPKGVFEWTLGWMLTPSDLPQMELTPTRLHAVRKSNGVNIPENFPQQKKPFIIPARDSVTLLLDQSYLTNAYPTLEFSKGKDARISIAYAEALYIDEGAAKPWKQQNAKGNRNEVEGKRFVGKEDVIISNGAVGQQYTSLWWRTYRYVQLKVVTKEQPLTIEDVYGLFTGYPFQYNAKFAADNTSLNKILEVGWRTARLCAFETYMDCPYYEQLQYVGDTRIQALISLYNSGDDRLMRQAIEQIDHSRMAEGITLSRFPSANAQQIPPFSLWWIGMLHDYYMYRYDTAFIRNKLFGMRQVLSFFQQHQQEDGSLKDLPYWNFTDWAEGTGWYRGVAPIGKNGNSAALDLQLLWAYQLASELEQALGMNAFAIQYKTAADKLKATIKNKYWNASKSLFADTPEKDTYSQHTNTLAILTGIVAGKDATLLANKILKEASLTEATIYFKYYVHQALIKAGLGNDYLNWLDIWHQNLAQGLTTWAEISDINKARSDCHAWGSHPNIEFFRTILGIDTDAPGFKVVKIEPHLGSLKSVSGEIPHPDGIISTKYIVEGTKTTAAIHLPKNTAGHLLWKGKKYDLKKGETTTITLQ